MTPTQLRCGALSAALVVLPATASAQLAGFDLEGAASAEIWAAAGSGALVVTESPEEPDAAGGVVSLGAGVGGRLALVRPTPEERGARTTLALLPGVDWTDRWGAEATLSLGATLDEWLLSSTRLGDEFTVDAQDIGDPSRRPVAVEQELRVAVGVGEIGQRLSYQGPVRFTDRVWLSHRDLLGVGVHADVPAALALGPAQLMGVGVAYDAWLVAREDTDLVELIDEDATRRARSAVTVWLHPATLAFDAELTPVEVTIGDTTVVTHTFHRETETGVPDGATATDVQFEAARLSGVRVGDNTTVAVVGGVSVMSPAAHDEPVQSEVAVWGEAPAGERRSSVGALWGVEVTAHGTSARVHRPFGDMAGVVSRVRYPAWTVGVHSFHRLDPTGLAVDAGAMASVQRRFVLPGDAEAWGEGSIVWARRQLVSDLATEGELPLDEGDDFWIGRLEVGVDKPFGDHVAATARAWAERSDRATVTAPGIDDVTEMRGDVGALVGLRLML